MRNLKKVIALIAVFAMMVSTVAFAAAFDDVDDSSTYSEAIQTLNKLGILTGDDEDGDGVMSFRPEDSITRAEITVIVARIQGQTGAVAQANTIFTDVPSTYWASGYIASATATGVINGYGDGTFGPDDNVQYQDVIKMLMETLGYKLFAEENGGYPTGYLLAASRQGVLDGVIGGSEGVEATRGQVAQLTYNAISAPLMDKLAYGGNGTYIIYDGTNGYSKRTCMTDYLGLVKFSGYVTENAVTSLDSSKSIDTSVKETVRITVNDLYDVNDTNYVEEQSYYLYVGDTDAASYLGYNVTAFVQKNGSSYGTLLSVTPTQGQNTVASFTLDQYDSFDGTYVNYMKNETDRSATRLKLQAGAYVVYNGVGGYTLNDVFDKIVTENSTYSGSVTLVDNDDISGYDVVFVNVAASAVVDELTSRGVVTFKNAVGDRFANNTVTRLDFTDEASYINITKDGQPYDYTALKEWDVLSIVANTAGYYDVEVLDGEASKIVGTVARTSSSDTSSDGVSYTVEGVDYDLAEGAYTNGTLRAGSYGAFYIDKYGKIAAYNREGDVASTNDNYAYVLNANTVQGTFGKEQVTLQLLYKDGTIQTPSLASTVTVYNPPKSISPELDDYATFKYDDADNLSDVIDDLVGQVVTVNATNGEIKTITLPYQTGSAVDSFTTLDIAKAGAWDYEEDTQVLTIGGSKQYITDDTLVFFVGGPNDQFAPNAAPASNYDTENCSVSSGAALSTMSGSYAVAYTNYNTTGDIDVLVLYNTDVAASPSAGVAYVTAIGNSSVDGTNVLSVSYYQDGEYYTAYTDGTIVDDLTVNTVPGSLFKFGKTGDTITSAVSYLTFKDTVRDKVSATNDGTPNVVTLRNASGDEDIIFGAVTAKSGNRLTIATSAPGTLPSLDETDVISLANYDANYYLYDTARSGNGKFQIGSIGDVYVDSIIANANYGVSYGSFSVPAGEVAWGLLDYVFIRTYERTADVVIYAAYEYDYSIN